MRKVLLLLAVLFGVSSAWADMAITCKTVPDPAAGIVKSFGPEIPVYFTYSNFSFPSVGKPIAGSAAVTVRYYKDNKDDEAVIDLGATLVIADDALSAKIVLDQEVTTPGFYTFQVGGGLTASADALAPGSGLGNLLLNPKAFAYTIEEVAADEAYEVVANPADGSTLSELSTIDLRFRPEGSEEYLSLEGAEASKMGVTISPQKGLVSCSFPDGDRTVLRVTCALNNEPIREEGRYTLTLFSPYEADGPTPFYFNFPNGKKVDFRDMNLTYTVETPTGIGQLEGDGAAAEYYDLMGRRVAQPQSGVYVRVAGGKAVKVVK